MGKIIKIYKTKVIPYTDPNAQTNKLKSQRTSDAYVPPPAPQDERINKQAFSERFRELATNLWDDIYGADKITESSNVSPISEFFGLFKSITVSRVDNQHYRIDGVFNKQFVEDVVKYVNRGRKFLEIFEIITETKFLFFKKTYVIIHEFFIPELYALLLDLFAKTNKSIYAEAAVKIKNNTWLKNTVHPQIKTKLHMNKLKDLKWSLKSFQKEFVDSYPTRKDSLGLRGFILAFDQGLGKTFTSLALMHLLNKSLVAIFCPKTLMSGWKDEIKSIFKNPPPDDEIYLVGKSTSFNPKTKYIISNYERIDEVKTLIDQSRSRNVGIIVDECQNFRNIKSKRTQLLLNLVNTHQNKINDVLLLSGTPIKSNYAELAPYLSIIDPKFDNEALKIWLKVFNVDESIASDIIKYRFKLISDRKLKSDVLQLPEKKHLTVSVSIPDTNNYTLEFFRNQVKEQFIDKLHDYQSNFNTYYNKFLNLLETIKQLAKKQNKTELMQDIDNYIIFIQKTNNGVLIENIKSRELKDSVLKIEHNIEEFLSNTKHYQLNREFKNLKTIVTRITYKVYGEVVGNLLSTLRSQMVYEIYKFNTDKICKIISDSSKTVIFTYNTQVIPKIKDIIEKSCKVKAITITGATKDRGSVVEQFKSDPNIKVLIASYQVAAVGLTLTEADTMIYADKPYREADLQQAEDRIYRIGQDKPVKIIYLKLRSNKRTLQDRIDDIVKYFGNIVNLAIQ